jgi:hypothetical protein
MESMGEPIQVCEKRYNYFPKIFRWRGQLHHIRAVERCWTVTRRRWLHPIQRHCFRVRTVDATYDLVQELDRDAWYLHRVVEERT